MHDAMKVATLEQQVAHLERQRQQEAASLRGSAEHMQREMQGHCTNLQAQLEALQVTPPPAPSLLNTSLTLLTAQHLSTLLTAQHHLQMQTESESSSA